MDACTKRKLNLLIHLARVDGKFHHAEKALIREFVKEKGFEAADFQLLQETEERFQDLQDIDDKKEVLYLAIKLMQADDVIDRKEMAFCKELALKLGYKPAFVDIFADITFDRTQFDGEIAGWRM